MGDMEALANAALESVGAALNKHGRGVVGFSGGKESVVLKHLLAPFKEVLEFVWVNPGASLPHMAEFVRSHGVTEVSSDQAHRFTSLGLPTRVIPIFNTRVGLHQERGNDDRLMLTDWVSCCHDLRLKPGVDFMHSRGISLLVYGQRADDGFAFSNLPGNDELIAPLWHWSTVQVMGYIEANSLALPEQYSMGCSASIECWNCTAEAKPERFKYLAQQYPKRWAALAESLASVRSTWMRELRALDSAMAAANESGLREIAPEA